MEALSDAQLAAEVAGISGIELCKFFGDFSKRVRKLFEQS